MKTRFIFFVILLFFGSLPFTPVYAAESVPAPEFISLSPDGIDGNMIFEVNETITVTYNADRKAVDGLILLGSGSGLTEDVNNPAAINFTKVSSLKEKSTYEAKFNLTTYTEFYAFAWSGSLTNGTSETFENFDGTTNHRLWTSTNSYPVFSDVQNGKLKNSEYYVPINAKVNITYTVTDPKNDATMTIAFGDNSSQVFDGTNEFAMQKLSRNSQNVTTFYYEYNHTQRIIFFSAYSGVDFWERTGISEKVHVITNGFSFNSEFSENIEQYTDIDNIVLNVTAYNKTADDTLSFRYRVLENITSDTIMVDWTSSAMTVPISSTLENNTDNFNTTVDIFQGTIDKSNYDIGEIVEVQTYVIFNADSTYNESQPLRIEIRDSRPFINIHTANNTYINYNSTFVEFSFSNVRSSIKNATISSNYTSGISIKGKVNTTFSLMNAGELINGLHLLKIVAFNNLDRSRTVYVFVNVDTVKPVASFLDTSDKKTSKDGKVAVQFDFDDEESTASGIMFAELDWGDGIAVNVTNLRNANHTYRATSDNFDLTLTVYDKAGNKVVTTLTVVVDITPTSSNTKTSPVYTIYIILSISFVTIFTKRRR